MRTAVFDHVQRMPIAFFTRTRTGALVSRLNNDVIGAQRAFSDTLSGVVSNVVTLVLTLVVMLGISWQITALALVLLPVFVLPARRMGAPSGAASAARRPTTTRSMSTQMTERFSAPGATLVKLFGRPEDESAEFAARASRVRDIGVRTAMVQSVFVTALTLVSALALALVYGLGGVYALRGSLDAGDVVALALLLTRLYAPLTALANARVEVMSALVSFERVFEVLDLEPLISDEPDARAASPTGRSRSSSSDVRFAYPSADKVSLASLEEVAQLDTRGGVEVLHDISFRVEPGQLVALVGSSGAGKSTIAQLVPRLYDVDGGVGAAVAASTCGTSRPTRIRHALGHGHPGRAPVPRVDPGQPAARPAGGDRGRRCGTPCAGPGWSTLIRYAAGRARHRRRRARLPASPAASGSASTIARLLLAQPRVVILDEATAHLDSTSEAAVQAALAEALAGRTALVIAHRLSTVRAADLILVVEDGRIVERGTHAELLAAGGRYEELYRTQFAEAATVKI
ncbi:MAG: ABC transporter ATP-binding protein [Nocardioidaceae bacterium]